MVRATAVALLVSASILGACATYETTPVPLANAFDAAAFDWTTIRGNGAIKGDAVLRTRGGDVKTCAGLSVRLIPVTPHTEEWVMRRFSTSMGGYSSYDAYATRVNLDPGASRFIEDKRCNAQGAFSFEGLPDGEYFVVATVTWEALSGYGSYTYMAVQGGDLAQRVRVTGGETQTITISQ